MHLERLPQVDLLYKLRIMCDECEIVVGMKVGRGKRSTETKSAPVVTLSTLNPTLPDLRTNPLHQGGKPAINRYGKACFERFA
jgi:hypothetical protein